jgi:2-phosphosulfolactate phosphatase
VPEATPAESAPLLNVDLLPRPAGEAGRERYHDVVVVVDVLRTTTTVPVLFDRGLEGVRLSPSLRVARRTAGEDGALLIGERRGVPPEGFNHGNSPATLAERDLRGARAVMVSENAPAALPHLVGAAELLLASLVNAGAAARHAARRVTTRVDLVCCGFRGEADLDDLLTAGFLADRILRLRPDVVPTGATRLALDLMHAEPDPLRLLWRSRAGRYLRGLGLERDIGFAADLDRSSVVPVLAAGEHRHGGVLYPFAAADVA